MGENRTLPPRFTHIFSEARAGLPYPYFLHAYICRGLTENNASYSCIVNLAATDLQLDKLIKIIIKFDLI